MAEDGKVIYKIEADDSGISKQLDQSEKTIKTKTSAWEKLTTGALNSVGNAAVDMALKAGQAVIQFGSDFEQTLANASTLIDTNVTDMDALSEKILELSDNSGVAASELNNALYSALSAGVPATEDMAEAMGFLEDATKLAKAGFSDVDTVVGATAKVLNAYGMSVEQTDQVHKVLMQTQNLGITTVGELGSVLAQVTPTAASMGVSFEQVGASLATMTAQGTPAAQATTQLNSLIAELGKDGTMASEKLKAAAESAGYAGMSFNDMMEAGWPLNEVLNLMDGYAQQNGVSLLDMFSSIEAGKAALSMAGENSQKFADNLAAMATETDVVGEAYDKVTSTSGASFNEILNRLKNTAIKLFESLVPIVEEALPPLLDLLDEILPAVEPVAEIIGSLAKILMSILKPAIEAVTPILKVLVQLLEGVSSVVGFVADGVSGLSESLFGGGSDNSTPSRHQSGEDFVMSDWTPAFLDYGERVLTKEENAAYTALGGVEGMAQAAEYAQPQKSITDVNVGLKVEPREMAHAITPYVVEELKRKGDW